MRNILAGLTFLVSVQIAAGQITLIGRVTEGTKQINGISTTHPATIDVLDTGSGQALMLAGGSTTVTADSTTGAFSLILQDPLFAGQTLAIRANAMPRL